MARAQRAATIIASISVSDAAHIQIRASEGAVMRRVIIQKVVQDADGAWCGTNREIAIDVADGPDVIRGLLAALKYLGAPRRT